MRKAPLSKNPRDIARYLPKCVVFGPGARNKLRGEISGKKILIICSPRGKNQFLSDSALKDAINSSESYEFLDVANSYPSVESIQVVADQPSLFRADLLVGFGGGSAIDFAKSLSALDPTNHLQSNLRQLIQFPNEIQQLKPVIAIPTNSGTGAEVTSFSTIWDHEAQKKLSLTHPKLKPSLALVDPELTCSVPPSVTLETGLDALNQAFESVWNINSTTESFQYACNAIALILTSLSTTLKNGGDLQGRINLSLGATLAGLAINLTKTSICHSISYPLTAKFGVPHGVACAFSMLAVIEIVNCSTPEVFEGLAENIGFKDAASLITRVNSLLKQSKVREKVKARVGDLSRLSELVPEMQTQGRSDNFIAPVTEALITNILLKSACD